MAYYLGIDIGTTYSAAAVWRGDPGERGQVTVANLGERAPVVPSVLYFAEDGTVLVGEAAERRGSGDPRRMAREFKRRVGDPTPIIVGGTPYSADALMSRLLRWVVDEVVAAEVAEGRGAPPDGVAVSYPANWGAFKQDLLAQEIRLADLGDGIDVATLTEPEAAAIYYASQERVADGAVVAVYDLGGGTFDVAVLRKVADGWHILGEPEGIERLGGIDFDEAVFRHVTTTLGDEYEALDPDDDATLQALTRVRRECVEAKEALSEDTDVTIPVLLPGIQRDVRLTRVEFEDMIRPALTGSIEATRRALRAAKVETSDVTAVLLVGGSSRVPLVGQMIGAELGRPVAIDVHPKYGIALGAAILAAERASDTGPLTSQITAIPADTPSPPDAPSPVGAALAGAAAGATAAAMAGAEVAPESEDGPAETPPGDGEAAFDVAADGPPVGDGPEVPVESVDSVAASSGADDDAGGPPTDPTAPIEPASTPEDEPVAEPPPEPPRTVRVPAPVLDEPAVTEPIVVDTAEQPAVAVAGPRNGNGGGNGRNGGARPPAGRSGRGGRLALLAAVALLVAVMAGVLFKLTEDGSNARTTGGTTTTSGVTQPSTTITEPTTTTSTDPPTTTTTTTEPPTTAPPLVEVPDVTGATEAKAVADLEAQGLSVGSTEQEASDDVAEGRVTRTDPGAGSSVEPGSSVVLFVSTGPDQVTVPEVTGQPEAEAIAEIEAAGLTANSGTAPVDDPAQDGLVVDQNPDGGATAEPGSTVDITVGDAP